MASDKKRYVRALANWDRLHINESYSVPSHIGKVAILCSYVPPVDPTPRQKKSHHKEIRLFRKEAFALAERYSIWGKESEVILNVTDLDVTEVMRDPSFSDIVTIGHGSLSTLSVRSSRPLDSGYRSISIDWEDIAHNSNHLKTGCFTQRQCGTYDADLPTPLGTFAMTDHRNVFACVGMAFEPRGLDDEVNMFLQPVTDISRLTYRGIKAQFHALV